MKPAAIDRHALVTRHNVTLTKFNGDNPIQVGNGEFAFGMDVTGLQTFAPFNTMSHWGWNTLPLPAGVKVSDFQGQVVDTHGRPVRYPMPDPAQPAISTWLAGNPHAINLGRLGFIFTKRDGSRATQADLQDVHQTLNLWTGVVESRFSLESSPVVVTTACHPDIDSVAVKVDSPLIKDGRLSVFLDAPDDNDAQFANFIGDWSSGDPLALLPQTTKGRAEFVKRLSGGSYHIALQWAGSAQLHQPVNGAGDLKIEVARYGAGDHSVDVSQVLTRSIKRGCLSVRVGNSLGGDPAPQTVKALQITYSYNGHQTTETIPENGLLTIGPVDESRRYMLVPSPASNTLSFVCAFSKVSLPSKLPSATDTIAASQKSWPQYWKSGGAIDLSASTDSRASELERRIVLSQYLLAVNEAGGYPPQESGLVNNGWFGRWHMEMYWWHAAHWALWNRWSELDRSLGIYNAVLAKAKLTAKSEGYQGARWPKCIGPNFVEWPHIIHSLLIWQQPHPIFFADLDYRAHPSVATLKKWEPVVEATADFMASYAFWDAKTNRYVLGPPVVLVSENSDPITTQNPTFELGYWRFGLRMAQQWREKLGLPRRKDWDKVLAGLAPLPVQDGVYVLHENVKDMWTKWNFEHPALTGVFGILPGDGVDKATMKRTLAMVKAKWDFNHTWGWDFPMLAMCAARLGEPEQAVDFLMTSAPGFQFDERGLASGGPFPYFPSNGGLLYAVAMMAQGWDGSHGHAPGFPASWHVRSEGLTPAP